MTTFFLACALWFLLGLIGGFGFGFTRGVFKGIADTERRWSNAVSRKELYDNDRSRRRDS